MLKRLNLQLLNTVSKEAQSNTRLRQNLNFHAALDEKVQRFVNGFQPGTYVRPHRHLRANTANGFEFFLILQGAVGMLLFNHEGQIIHKEQLSRNGDTFGVELSEGIYHTLVALLPDTVILEIKEGPYDSYTDKDFLPLFPLEGTIEAQELVQTWQTYFN